MAASATRLMPIVSSLRDGLRRVLRAPVILTGVTLLAAATAAPLNLLLQTEPPHPGDTASYGWTIDWMRRCAAPAMQVDRSTDTIVTGCAAVVALAPGAPSDRSAQTFVIGYLLAGGLLLWTFLSGGVLDRYARDRPTRTTGFFSACGWNSARLLRLLCLSALTHGLLFTLVHHWIFSDLYSLATSDGAAITQAVVVRTVLYLVFGCLVAAVGLVFDYARVRAVVEDRRSAIGALLAAWRFVRRRPAACAGLYVVNGIIFGAALSVTRIAPSEASVWLLSVTLACLALRVAGRLYFYAVETAYFQSQLAHAGYVAAPAPVWPESPSAEALGRLG